jgi:hypothetical protein
MATVFTVPLNNTLPSYKFKITLSGVIFTLVLRFNTRTNTWFMDIQDPSGNPILTAIPVLIERELTSQYTTLAIPAGVFAALDETGQENQPSLYSFGTTHVLLYLDPTQ